MLPHRRFTVAIAAALLGLTASRAVAEPVDVYAAGSLRSLVSAIGGRAAASGIEIRPIFGGAGSLRDKIEKGDKPDVLLSADMASPVALAGEGRTILPAVAFARNRLCIVARRSLGLKASNLVERLLAPGLRIKTSHPVADPAGDYAMAMFDLMDRAHPGAGRALRADAAQYWDLTPPSLKAGQNGTAALFAARRIDVAVTYCSASGDIVKTASDLESIVVPDAYDPKPVYGLAILSANPAAARLALLILSEFGQSAVAGSGLLPLMGTAAR